MTSIPQSSIADELKKMITYCHHIHNLLESDGKYFIENDYLSVEESNKKKIELLAVLTENANKLNSHFPGGLRKYISTHIEKSSLRDELTTLLNQLNNEVVHCYNYIELHGKYFTASLQSIKDTVQKAMEAKNEEGSVYNQSGVIA